MPLAAKWMNLEIVILTEGSQKQRKTNIIYHLYVKSRKSGTNEFIYKTEIDSQMEGKKKNLQLLVGGKREGIL